MGVNFRPHKINHKYQFGEDKQNSLGSIPIRIPIQDNKVIQTEVDVVAANVPFLIGLDFLDKH